MTGRLITLAAIVALTVLALAPIAAAVARTAGNLLAGLEISQ